MNNVDALRISQQRDDIYDWACDRFKELIAEDRVDDALAFADEYYEWLDPEQLDSEVTLFSNFDELTEYYRSIRS
jgi:hypothetical protein